MSRRPGPALVGGTVGSAQGGRAAAAGRRLPASAPGQPAAPSFECAVCLEVLRHPVRTPWGHVFCHSCISASLKNNAWTCPYCCAYLPSEGIPATDIATKMESTYQNCTEYEMQKEPNCNRYSCPYCQCEVDEDELMDHCLAYHRSERRAVDINTVEVLAERVIDRSFLEYVHVNHPNST